MPKRTSPVAATTVGLDAATIRELAVQAGCDPRTITAIAGGRSVRGLAGKRAREALEKAGYVVPRPGQSNGSGE